MQNNDFDKGIRDLLNSNEPEYNPADWDRMEDLLHQAGATNPNPKQGIENTAAGNAGGAAKGILAGGKVWVAAAIVALTGVNVAVLVTSQNASETPVSLTSGNKTDTQGLPETSGQPLPAEISDAGNEAAKANDPVSDGAGLAQISAGSQGQNNRSEASLNSSGATASFNKLPILNSASGPDKAGRNSANNKSGSFAGNTGNNSVAPGNSGNAGTIAGLFQGIPGKAGIEPVAPCAGNRQPILPYLISGTDTVTNFQFTLKTCEPFCLNLPGSDAEGDKINFSASLAQMPGALFETNPENDTQASFCWTPKAAQARTEPYALKVNLKNENCPGYTTYTILLTVAPGAGVRISGDTLLMAGQQTRLRAISSVQEVSYKWLPAEGLSGSLTNAEVVAAPAKTTTYTLQLTTANGCQLQTTQRIRVATEILEQTVFVPNIFTPNGDGVNDFFEVKGMEPGKMDLTVYNRSGKTVFSSPNYTNTWNGGNLPEGVYTYVLRNTQNGKLFRGMVEINR